MTIVIHHNPECGTSRNVLEIIRGFAEEPIVVEYLKTGWTREQLQALFAVANLTPREALWARKSPPEKLGLTDPTVADEIIFKKTLSGQRRAEYYLTPAGKELAPIVMSMGDWGQKWARSRMDDDELDIELLMLEFFRRLEISAIPGGTLVAHFHFPALETYPHWWIVIDGEDERELCVAHPGRDVDITIKSDARTMCEIWNGDTTFTAAKKDGRIKLEGLPIMKRSISKWLRGGLLTEGKLVDQL